MLKISEQTRDLILKGKIGVLPTDTIYGLSCSAFSKPGVEKIYALKNKPRGFPLIIIIGTISDLRQFGIKLSAEENKFLKTVWPNPITVILNLPSDKSLRQKFKYLHRGTNSLSFRLPNHPELIKLLKKTGPLISTSANPHNQKCADNIEETRAYFHNNVDFYEDWGVLTGQPSTIVKIEEGGVYLMREGKFELPKKFKYNRIIKKKTWPELFQAILDGKKKFDLRVADFTVEEGDMIELMEYDPETQSYTGRTLFKKVSYILKFNPEKYPFAKAEDVKRYGLQVLSLE